MLLKTTIQNVRTLFAVNPKTDLRNTARKTNSTYLKTQIAIYSWCSCHIFERRQNQIMCPISTNH